ncbi:MAG: hypothetical protein R3A10_00560 [Caldilineaceae bacterium]
MDFGPVRLDEAGVTPDVVAGTNAPVAVRLGWSGDDNGDDDLVVTLRLTDVMGRTWTSQRLRAKPGLLRRRRDSWRRRPA